MAKFRFRLSAVERVRDIAEKQAMSLLAEAYRKVDEEKEGLFRLVKALEASFARREVLGRDTVKVAAFAVENDFIDGQKKRILRQQELIKRYERVVEKALQNYIQAKKKKTVIEQVKERDRLEFKREMSKREQKRIDDMISTRFDRGEAEGA